MPEAMVEKTTLWRDKLIIGLRGLQIITIGFAVTGVIWSTSDFEGVIRVLERKLGKANFLGEREGDG